MHVSRGCDQCTDLEIISRLTVGEGEVVITHAALILNVDAQFNLLSYFLANLLTYVLKKITRLLLINSPYNNWLTLSGGAAVM